MNAPLRINAARLHADIAALGSIGRDPDTGLLQRQFNNDGVAAAREWLARRLDSAGFEHRIDEHGNLATPPVTAGRSSVAVIAGNFGANPCSAALTGALAISIGLECLRCLKALNPGDAPRLALLALADEKPPDTGVFEFALDTSATSTRLSLLFSLASQRGDYTVSSPITIGLAQNGYASTPVARLFASAAEVGVDFYPVENEFAEPDPGAIPIPECRFVIPAIAEAWPPDDHCWRYADACAEVILNGL